MANLRRNCANSGKGIKEEIKRTIIIQKWFLESAPGKLAVHIIYFYFTKHTLLRSQVKVFCLLTYTY